MTKIDGIVGIAIIKKAGTSKFTKAVLYIDEKPVTKVI
nr:MAG TPA: hypothetical protein [Caudoviricetes sp.]